MKTTSTFSILFWADLFIMSYINSICTLDQNIDISFHYKIYEGDQYFNFPKLGATMEFIHQILSDV